MNSSTMKNITVQYSFPDGTKGTVVLTRKEAVFLIRCLNYDTVEQQLGDNYSNGGIDEAMDLFLEHDDMNTRRQAAGGLLTSLYQKGLGGLDREYDRFCLSEAGVRAAFAV